MILRESAVNKAYYTILLQSKLRTNMHRTHHLSTSEVLRVKTVNPSNAEATFVQSTRTQILLKTIKSLSCRYSLDGSRRVLSDEYHMPGFSDFSGFLHHFVLVKLANSSIRVKGDQLVAYPMKEIREIST